jgi:hypothetical protein
MDEYLKSEISKIIGNNSDLSINDLNKLIHEAVNHYNNVGIDDFEGLSPENMYDLLYNEFDKNIGLVRELG